MSLVLNFLGQNYSSRIRESACECLKEVSIKGMMPADKLTLVETLWAAVQSSNVYHLLNVRRDSCRHGVNCRKKEEIFPFLWSIMLGTSY